MIRKGLPTYLLAQSTITDLVGQRVRPVKIPQSDAINGAIVFRRLPKSDAHRSNLDLTSGEDQPTFRLECFSSTYTGAVAIAEALRNKMQNFDGTMGSVTVTSCTIVDDYDEYIEPEDGSDAGVFAVVLDYDIQYIETIPAL